VDRKPDQTAINNYHQAILRLNDLDFSKIPAAKVLPNGSALLHFDPKAQDIFNTWLLTNERLLMSGRLDQARQSHISKYRSLVPALALLFHLLDDHPGRVGENCIVQAINFAIVLKSHAYRVYASVSGHDLEATRSLAAHLLVGDLPDGFTRRGVEMKGWSGLNTKARAEEALEALVELGWLYAEEVRVGRPTVKYYLHPEATEGLL
jgi:hypothetical protein